MGVPLGSIVCPFQRSSKVIDIKRTSIVPGLFFTLLYHAVQLYMRLESVGRAAAFTGYRISKDIMTCERLKQVQEAGTPNLYSLILNST